MPHDVWAGIDAGKIAHHCVVINDAGEKLLSRKVSNDEADLLRLIGDVADLANGGRVLWAVDLNAGGAALLIALLVERDHELVYIRGRTVHHASAAYLGDGKTDAKDAAVIVDQVRMRRDLHPFRQRDEITVDLPSATGSPIRRPGPSRRAHDYAGPRTQSLRPMSSSPRCGRSTMRRLPPLSLTPRPPATSSYPWQQQTRSSRPPHFVTALRRTTPRAICRR